jgi:N-glycosylase/DNA lyase
MKKTEGLLTTYKTIKNTIRKRLSELALNWNKSEKHIFAELAFCICTPLSKAVHCNEAVNKLEKSGVLFTGNDKQMKAFLQKVRFNNHKSKYILTAREFLTENGKLSIKKRIDVKNIYKTREWLADNVKGIGFKEASHFLRNIGFGSTLAILDVHVLKNLCDFGVIKRVPDPVSRKAYIEIERKMKIFSKKIGIPMIEMDLLLWHNETGCIVK